MRYSILIPAYKGNFFKECLESVFSQTYQDFEVIVLNDCSPDALESIISKFPDKRLRYYANDRNVGAVDGVDNWNKLLSYAKGEFVVCMGDDDKLSPDFLESYNKLMEIYPGLDLYHARTEIIDEKSECINIQADRPEWESAFAMLWNNIMRHRLQFIGDFLFRTSTLRAKGGFFKLPLAWASDCVSALIAASDKGCANLHHPTFFYRSNPYSITSSKNISLKVKALYCFEDWVRNFISTTPVTGLDVKYKILISNGLDHRIVHDVRFMISEDLKNNGNIIFWLKNKRRYRVSVSTILVSLVMAIGLKIKNL